MHPDFEAFQNKFRLAELTVHRNPSWTWSVRTAQPTLGSGVLSLNRYALELSEVSAAEMADFAEIVGRMEATLKAVFDVQIMNYLALMMVDRHVHFHAIPRYDGEREFTGKTWVDNGWPALPINQDAQHAGDEEILTALRDALRAKATE